MHSPLFCGYGVRASQDICYAVTNTYRSRFRRTQCLHAFPIGSPPSLECCLRTPQLSSDRLEDEPSCSTSLSRFSVASRVPGNSHESSSSPNVHSQNPTLPDRSGCTAVFCHPVLWQPEPLNPC